MANQPTKYKKFLAGAASATLVATAIVPTALAADATTAATDFSDVAASHTHYAAIMQAVERGLFNGYTDGTFKPENTIDRKGVVKSLANYVVSQSDYKTYEEYITANKLVEKVTPFNDVPATHGDAELFNASLIVKDSGIFTGSNNNLMPSNNITRQQMAKVLVNGFGLKDLAGVESKVTDNAKAQAEYVNFINILSENGVTDQTAFNPTGNLKRGQMASFLNRSYDSAHKVVAPETATKVVSVSATNLKEVLVTFDGSVDRTTAENKDAYVVKKGLSLETVESAELQADGKSVILTMAATLTNQSKEYTLSVDGIKAGKEAVSVKDFAFTPLDQALPTVESVQGLGNKAVKITFNEPVKLNGTVASAFKIDDKVVSGIATITGRTVTIELFSTLTDGSHELTVNNNVIDYSNYQLVETSKKFEVVADTAAPTIKEVKDATLEGVTVVFSEDIKKTEAELASNFYWMSGSTKKVATKATLINPTTVRLSFTANPLPGYTTDLFVTNVSDYSSNKIAAGSKVAVTAQLDQARPEVLTSKYDNSTKQLSVTFSKNIKADSFKASNLVVKDSDGKVVTNGYTGTVTDNKLVVNFTTALKAGSYTMELNGLTDTTLLANAMLPYTTTAVVTNLNAPNATGITGTGGTYVVSFDKKMDVGSTASILNPDNYFVTYRTTETPSRTITGKLPAGTNLSPTNDGKGVIVTFPSGVAGLTSFTVQGVKDTDGNFIANYAKTFTSSDIVATARVSKAVATSTTKVNVTMNQPMGYVNKADFTVGGVAVDKAEISATDSKVVVLTLATPIGADAKVAGLAVSAAIKASPETVNPTVGLTNAPVLAGSTAVVADEISSAVLMNASDKISVDTTINGDAGIEVASTPASATPADNRITVNFDEAVTAVNSTKIGENFKLYKEDGTQLVDGLDYTAGITSGKVELTLLRSGAKLVGYDGKLQLVLDNTNENIVDASDNVVADFDTATDVVDGATGKNLIKFSASPLLTGASLTETTNNDAFGDLGDTLTLTFSENIALALTDTTADANGKFDITAAEIAAIATALNPTDGTYTAKVSGSKVIIEVATVATSPVSTVSGATGISVTGGATAKVTDLVSNSAIAGSAFVISND